MKKLEKESIAMCWILRHGATKINMPISKDGYVDVRLLILEMRKKFPNFSESELNEIVKFDEKSRYSILNNTIRCNQGHSMSCVSIDFKRAIPSSNLYHGTSEKNLELILHDGKIKSMSRHHVHLASDIDTAQSVGIRHGSEVIIELDIKKMLEDNLEFFKSTNNVWLIEEVDCKYFYKIHRKKK